MSRVLILLACLVVVGLPAFGQTDGPIICAKCGYENPSSSPTCSHCKAAVPGFKADRDATEPPKANPEQSEPSPIGNDMVEREIEEAQKQLAGGAPGVARLFCRNAMALGSLAGAADKTRSERILALMEQCDKKSGKVKKPCPTCRGTGERLLQPGLLKAGAKPERKHGWPCQDCAGKGEVMGKASIADQKFELGRSMKQYALLQRARDFVRIGNAWAPGDMEKKMSVRHKTSLKSALASPCAECMGFGRIDCDECRGKGTVPCTNRNCKDGMVDAETPPGLMKAPLAYKEKCKVCGGYGAIICPECNGATSTTCESCSGTGERQLCPKCGGAGLQKCARCAATDKTDKDKEGVCPVCRGEGYAECPTCGGEGRGRK